MDEQPEQPTGNPGNAGQNANFAEDEVNADMSSWYAPFKKVDNTQNAPNQPKSAKKSKAKSRPGLGFANQTAMLGSTQMQWTPEGSSH